MIRLVPYSGDYEKQTLHRISRFFCFHHSLVPGDITEESETDTLKTESRQTLTEWLTPPSSLFIILEDAASVGFIRIGYRGPNVAWIEDIFVDAGQRGRGVATNAIKEAERVIMAQPGYTAVCLDVSPRNLNALKLYHRLGYVDLGLITIRKELGADTHDKTVRLFDLNFNY